ncbi:hypothetical protein BDZ85DRAFT_298310 [Elsinoe ampelina]|uniref:Major facilitator superfamily (MFS) profile domain-containing protein n=1 Tax=Elsinoe ampelina TaxID=302913 RepID=A0A6A6G3V5_9PEZI|nr:hypothetical protein BDZ85DRAFT_298310 [Elsinoe ampelina]
MASIMDPDNEKPPASNSALEPFPAHDALPDFHIVDESPFPPENEKEKPRSKPKKKLRFQRIRGSVASEISDGNGSLWIEPEHPLPRPQKWRMGMLEDRAIGGVPGTTTLFDNDLKYRHSLGASPSAFSSHLPTFHTRLGYQTPKTPRSPVRKRARDGKTVLEPQPDDSHNDPLNWRGWRRWAAVLALGVYGLVGGAMGTVFATGFGGEEKEEEVGFAVDETRLGLMTGLFMVGLAVGSVFLTPVAVMFGKRVVYLGCAWLFLVTSVGCAFADVFAGFVVVRFFMGVAVSPVYTLVPATVAELFHVHQRGRVVGVYYFFLLAGMVAAPVASAAVLTSRLEWQWIFWITSVAAGLVLILLVFFVPESYWDRTLRPMHSSSCVKSRSRANTGGSARSYFSHCTCPIYTPPSPHPGKLVTFERLSPEAMERRAQAHREAAMQRYYENSVADPVETPMAAGAIISPPLPSSNTYKTAKSSPEGLTYISPRPFEDPRNAPSPPSRPPSAFIASSLNAHSSSSNPLRTTVQVDFASSDPPTTSPPSILKNSHTRTRTNTTSTASTLVPPRSRPTSVSARSDFYNPYAPSRRTRSPTPGPADRTRPSSISSQSSLSSSYSRPSSPPSPLSRSPSTTSRQSTQSTTNPLIPTTPSNHIPSQPSFPLSHLPPSHAPAASTSTLATATPDPDAGDTSSRPSLRLDLEQILLSRASVGAFTSHTGRSGYQNGFYAGSSSYFRTFHSSSIAGLTTPGRSAVPGGRGWVARVGGGGGGGGGGGEFGREYTERLRILPGLGWRKGLRGYELGLVEGAALGMAVLVGVLLGTVVMGVVGDVVVRMMGRANRGVFEPEFRFVGMLLGMMAAGAGLMGFGWVVEQKMGLEIVGVFLGLIGLGCAIGVTTAVGYVMDVVGGAVVEGMVVLTVIYALCHGLVFSMLFDRWVNARGPKEVFIVLGAAQVAIMAGAIPMYVFGKRMRAWGARKTLFEQI